MNFKHGDRIKLLKIGNYDTTSLKYTVGKIYRVQGNPDNLLWIKADNRDDDGFLLKFLDWEFELVNQKSNITRKFKYGT